MGRPSGPMYCTSRIVFVVVVTCKGGILNLSFINVNVWCESTRADYTIVDILHYGENIILHSSDVLFLSLDETLYFGRLTVSISE